MDAILEDIPLEQVDAVRALQQAMLEMLVSAEDEDGGEEGEDEGEEGAPTCAPWPVVKLCLSEPLREQIDDAHTTRALGRHTSAQV